MKALADMSSLADFRAVSDRMPTWALVGFAVVAIGAVVAAGVQTWRLADTAADLKTTQATLDVRTTERDVARAEALLVSRDRASAVAALEVERTRAVSAERKAADLRLLIARDAGTDRDGPTAPVLRDVLRALREGGQ